MPNRKVVMITGTDTDIEMMECIHDATVKITGTAMKIAMITVMVMEIVRMKKKSTASSYSLSQMKMIQEMKETTEGMTDRRIHQLQGILLFLPIQVRQLLRHHDLVVVDQEEMEGRMEATTNEDPLQFQTIPFMKNQTVRLTTRLWRKPLKMSFSLLLRIFPLTSSRQETRRVTEKKYTE